MPDVVLLRETPDGPTLSNGVIEISVHLNKGTYSIRRLDGAVAIVDAAFSVEIKDGPWPGFTSRGDGLSFEGTDDVADVHGTGLAMILQRETGDEEPELSLTISLYESQPFAILQLDCENRLAAPIRLQALIPLDGGDLHAGAPGSALRFYKHGWQSWSPTVVLDCAEEDAVMSPPAIGPGTQPPARPGRFISELLTAVVDPDTHRGVVAGFVSTADQFSHIWFDRDDASLGAVSWADGVEVAHKQHIVSERLYVEPTGLPIEALCRYGDALAREMEALPYSSVASGWCSWYYYFTEVTETEVLENLDQLALNSRALPVEYFQIDDGYQAEIGDWLETNSKFPSGMKAIADAIHSKGYQAGIWVAPFLAGARSMLFREHPDWFVKYSTGLPAIGTVNWGQPCFTLDTTHPGAIAYVREVFRTIVNDWGYDYVKIDFIFAAAVDGLRHDPNVTRAQAYRRGVEAVREAVGNRFILACGNPQGPSVGLVDGARVGPDVAPTWLPENVAAPRSAMSNPSALNGIRTSINRFWMHGRLWMNDPDCVMVRGTDTRLTAAEAQSLTTVIGLTGGMVLDSDKLSALSADRREWLSALLPVYGQTAVPLDLFQAPDVPRVLSLDCGTHTILGLFNWADEDAVISADLLGGLWHAFEFWAAEYLGVREGSVSLSIPAHGCKAIRLTRDLGHPQVVGSTCHITQGAMDVMSESWDGVVLRVRTREVARQNGRVYAWLPGGVASLAGGGGAVIEFSGA